MRNLLLSHQREVAITRPTPIWEGRHKYMWYTVLKVQVQVQVAITRPTPIWEGRHLGICATLYYRYSIAATLTLF